MELKLNKDLIIAASEVRDFVFCPVSFLLKRAGIELEDYEPESSVDEEIIKRQLELISAGRMFHEEIAEKVEKIFKQEKLAKQNTGVGIVFLVGGIILLIFLLFIR